MKTPPWLQPPGRPGAQLANCFNLDSAAVGGTQDTDSIRVRENGGCATFNAEFLLPSEESRGWLVMFWNQEQQKIGR
jgi:hypothetical protein